MHAKGHSPHPATFLGEPDGVRHVNSDIAFWDRLAFNGNYDGFRIIDISDPDAPQEIFHQRVTATRATSSSGTTSWFVPGTRRKPWHARATVRPCRQDGKGCTSSISAI